MRGRDREWERWRVAGMGQKVRGAAIERGGGGERNAAAIRRGGRGVTPPQSPALHARTLPTAQAPPLPPWGRSVACVAVRIP